MRDNSSCLLYVDTYVLWSYINRELTPIQPFCLFQIHALYMHVTYPFRFGEVHHDKAVVGCLVVSLKNELVSLVGDVLSEQRETEGIDTKGKEEG